MRNQSIVRIDVAGNRRVSKDDFLTYLRERPGQPFTPENLTRDVRELWDSGFTMSSRPFPTVTALGCIFEAPLFPPGLWGGSSRGSWGDAFYACWKKGGQRRRKFVSGMHHERMGTIGIWT